MPKPWTPSPSLFSMRPGKEGSIVIFPLSDSSFPLRMVVNTVKSRNVHVDTFLLILITAFSGIVISDSFEAPYILLYKK